MIGNMSVTSAKTLLTKIRDGKKATSEHLSSSGVRFCWDNTSNAYHTAVMFKMAVNDPAEIYFGTMAGHIHSYGKIGTTNSGGASQVRVSVNLSRGCDTGCKNKNTKWVEGIFNDLSEETRVSLVKMRI